MKEEKQDKRIWGHVRISFWLMIGLWGVSIIFESLALSLFFSLTWIATIIFNFVNSIRHLRKYKEKGFAITSLVISSIFLLLVIAGFCLGILLGLIEVLA